MEKGAINRVAGNPEIGNTEITMRYLRVLGGFVGLCLTAGSAIDGFSGGVLQSPDHSGFRQRNRGVLAGFWVWGLFCKRRKC